jgi:hypothetical protein
MKETAVANNSSTQEAESNRLQGCSFWFLFGLHLLLIPVWLLGRGSIWLPALYLTCLIMTYFLRRRTVSWRLNLSPEPGSREDQYRDGTVQKIEERPWLPILFLQLVFGLLPVVDGVISGRATGFTKYVSVLCMAIVAFTAVRDFFKHVRF